MFKSIRQNQLLKVLSLNSVSVMVSFVLGILSTKIISVFLGAPGMVLLGSFKNFSTMFKSVSTAGINNSAIKLFVENEKDRKAVSEIYSTFFWFFLGLSSILGIVILIFAEPISGLLFFTIDYSFPIRLFGLVLPVIALNTLWIAIYNSLKKFKRIIAIQIISNIVIFAVTAVLIWKQHIWGGLLAFAIGEIIVMVVTIIIISNDPDFRYDLRKNIKKKYLQVIGKFSTMALASAFLVPLTLIFIRYLLVDQYSVAEAGIWDAVNRLSGFYMILFGSGLSLYYMPKLASLQSDAEFKLELKSYFQIFVPLFFLMLIGIYLCRGFIVNLALTEEFYLVKSVLIWQLAGDFVRIMTLAFGYQILVKMMVKEYFIIEFVFNFCYLAISYNLMGIFAVEGVVQAYFYSNLITLAVVIWIFRKLFNQSAYIS